MKWLTAQNLWPEVISINGINLNGNNELKRMMFVLHNGFACLMHKNILFFVGILPALSHSPSHQRTHTLCLCHATLSRCVFSVFEFWSTNMILHKNTTEMCYRFVCPVPTWKLNVAETHQKKRRSNRNHNLHKFSLGVCKFFFIFLSFLEKEKAVMPCHCCAMGDAL